MFSNVTINPGMIKYIKEQTNKSLEKYNAKQNTVNYYDDDTPNSLVSMYYYIPFLSLFSFLAGYHFCHIIKNR